MLALLGGIEGADRCPGVLQSECCSEGSDAYTIYTSPASSCIEDYNVAAEVEISRDIPDDPEYSFYDQCLANLEADLKSSEILPWTNLADLGDTITEFSINGCRSRQTEGEFPQCENVCSDDYWDRCNLWVNSTSAEVEVRSSEDSCTDKPHMKSKRKCGSKPKRNLEKLSWNEMTLSERRGTIKHLTRVVSSTMGLREQLDVIRILNPNAIVSATDTEFEIDLELLNGVKLEQIREYVHKHRIQTVKTTNLKSSNSTLKKSKRKGTEHHHSRKGDLKAKKEENALLSRVYKQLLKEKRSGLFHNEQVISMSKTSHSLSNDKDDTKDGDNGDEDDVEIDILH